MSAWSHCLHAPVFDNIFKETDSLKLLACKYLVSDVSLFSTYLQDIPANLYCYLLQSAIEKRKELSIELILNRWPHKALSIHSCLNFILKHNLIDQLDYDRYTRYVNRVGPHLTMCLAQKFIDSRRKRLASKLCMLDLRGLPLTDLTVHYLASHCNLAYNESKKNIIVDLICEAKRQKRISDSDASLLGNLEKTISTLPEECYTVVCDCVLCDDESLLDLCKALKICKFGSAVLFRIIINSLELQNYSLSQSCLLLEQVDSEHLTGLSFRMGSFRNQGWSELLPIVAKFKNLLALDLSYNSINFTIDFQICDDTAQLLKDLSCLKRLDLGNNRLGRRLRAILNMMDHPLEYIRIAGCGITITDLIFLTNSIHTSSLTELSIASTSMTHISSELGVLLKHMLQLKVLDLSEINLNNNQLDLLTDIFLLKDRLIFVDLSLNNELSAQTICDMMSRLSNHTTLKGIKLSYPRDIYVREAFAVAADGGDNSDEIEINERLFAANIRSALSTFDNAVRKSPVECLLSALIV